jgi:hypothetical protein
LIAPACPHPSESAKTIIARGPFDASVQQG